MAPLFKRLLLWNDSTAREGPAQMACDEVLLEAATEPVLRVFRWTRPWVSAGYFVPWEAACLKRPDLPVCRRWTGGGLVVHDGDFTFSLAAPRKEPWARLRAQESYRHLHEVLTEALRQTNPDIALSGDTGAAGQDCFAGPVRHDVLLHGKKIAGGAQRRTKQGLLHQGTIQGTALDAGFPLRLAAALSGEVDEWRAPDGFEDRSARLTAEKYAREEFLRPGNL